MISLFTGVPGSGKTVMAVSSMLKLLKEGRPLFVHGIPNLTLPHELIVCNSPACEVCPTGEEREKYLKADEWHIWAPEGAIIFLDEVQNIYRPRYGSKNIPESIMAFETHRHKGLDFYIVSQSPRLFDNNIHAFIARHVHFKQNYMRRISYEWPEVKMNVQSTTDSIASTYKLDKSVFKLFKSSSLHTKVQRKIPPAIFLIPILLIAFVGGVFYVKNSIAQRAGVTDELQPKNQEIELQEDIPTPISSVDSSLDFPILSAVIVKESSGECFGYSQQGTYMELEQKQCIDFQKNRVFNVYKTMLDQQNKQKKQDERGRSSATIEDVSFIDDFQS